jgi:hypothetical protein
VNDLARLKSEIATTAQRLRQLRRELREAKGAPAPKARVRIRTRPKGGTWKADRDECDLLMGRIKKAEQPFCSACNTSDRVRLQWAHLITRRRLSVRWDWENSVVLCDACHFRYTNDEIGWQAWCNDHLGAVRWVALVRRSRLTTRFDPRILVGLRARAQELGVDTAEGWRAWQEAA